MEKYDFSGWATRNGLKCSDGRTIMKDAFKHNDGETVPLVWNHQHNDPYNILGHAKLENRQEGVYAYCVFNDSESGKTANLLVQHGDVSALSIFANQLQQQGGNVIHGSIREVSLVLAGANPGAFIDSVISHSDDSESDTEAIIYTGEEICLEHSDTKTDEAKAEDKEKTVSDVFDTLTEEQKMAVYAIIGKISSESDSESEDKNENIQHSETTNIEGDNTMKFNVFDKEGNPREVLSHSEIESIVSDAKRYGSLKDAVLAHGITNIENLFPEAQTVNSVPELYKRDTSWVSKVISAVHNSPFSRVKSTYVDITADSARAKGYVKGNQKVEEVIAALKRTTTPTTIYKKQKLDRDDLVDITDFDAVAWIKAEMRLMLDEEKARAILIGDGRSVSSDDKINEQNIRPIWTDDDVYSIKCAIHVSSGMTDDNKAKAFIRAAIKARKNYKGSGSPTLYTTEDTLTDCLLLEASDGRAIYDSVDKLATKLRVKEIVTVPVMENQNRVVGANTHTLAGIIVNLADYNVGADKGGAVNLFDDFDIDYNALKYLIETRCSGALTKPKSAMVFEFVAATPTSSGTNTNNDDDELTNGEGTGT